jgi:DNA-binding CsgD family transcriptional regulator
VADPYDLAMDRLRGMAAAAVRATGRWSLARYALAVVLVAVLFAIRELLLPGMAGETPFFASIITVLAASLVGGFGPGLLAVALIALVAAILYLPPIGHVAVDQPGDLAHVAGFLAEGAVVAAVGAWVRRSVLDPGARASASQRVHSLLGLQASAGRFGSDAPLVEPLSERELEVMRLVALGLRNDEIATTLFVSGNTVKTHLAHVYGKLGVRSRTEAVARCAALGLLDAPDEPRNAV